MLKSFWPYLRLLGGVRWAWAGALATGALYGGLSGFGLAFITDRLLPYLYRTEQLEAGTIFWLCMLIPLAMTGRALAQFANVYLVNYCGLRILEELRVRVFAKLQALSLAYFQRQSGGDLLSRVTNDTLTLQQAVSRAANDLLVQPLTLAGALAFVVYYALQSAQTAGILLCLLVLPVCVVPLRAVGKSLQKRAAEQQKRLGGVTEFVRENLAAAREIRAFGLEERQNAAFRQLVRDFLRVQLKVVKYMQALSPSIEVVSSFGIALAIFYARLAGVTFEKIFPLVIALYFAYDAFKKMGALAGLLRQGRAAMDRLEEVLAARVDVADAPAAVEVRQAAGRIEFDRVSFDYGEGPVLREISVVLEPGRTYALVGRSGAGKSTFASLVPRFHDPTAGTVRLDGRDLRQLTLASLRRQIALVSQDPVLFDDTLANNLRLGRPEASDAEVEQAARRALAHGFITGLEAGYQTRAGDRGARLSGGQRQRLALARAFLRDAPVLILDEATSALDAESEAAVQQALEELRRGRTALLIAHRFSSIAIADEVLVFEEGRIVERGTVAELLAAGGVFARLHAAQAK